jgi:site-specific recombinase XerD
VTVKRFAPYLREKKVSGFEGVTAQAPEGFQDLLLPPGQKPQTVNDSLKAVKRVFAYLVRKGLVKEDPYAKLKALTVKRGGLEARGVTRRTKSGGCSRKNGAMKRRGFRAF